MATAADAAEEYRATLAELTNNNKTQINLLTILAEDYAQFAAAIVQVIDAQILQVPPSLNVFARLFHALFIRTKSYSNLKLLLAIMGTLSPPHVVVNTNLLKGATCRPVTLLRGRNGGRRTILSFASPYPISDQRGHRQIQIHTMARAKRACIVGVASLAGDHKPALPLLLLQKVARTPKMGASVFVDHRMSPQSAPLLLHQRRCTWLAMPTARSPIVENTRRRLRVHI